MWLHALALEFRKELQYNNKKTKQNKTLLIPKHLHATLSPCWLFVPPGQKRVSVSGEGGSAVCVRAQEGSVKSLRCSFDRLTRLPPETTAIKPVVGCQSPLVVFFPDLITEGELNHSALTRDGGVTLFVGPFSRDSSLIWEESAFHLQEMCFQTQEHNKSYWQINLKKKKKWMYPCLASDAVISSLRRLARKGL